jgi:hypothetical protein
LHRERQNSRLLPSFAVLRPLSLRLAVHARSASRRVIATKAAMGAVKPTKDITMTTDRDLSDFEPLHTSSPTDYLLTELQKLGIPVWKFGEGGA